MLHSIPYRRLDGVRATYWLSTTRKVAQRITEALKPKDQNHAERRLPKAA